MPKKEVKKKDCGKYLRKLTSHHKIEDIAAINKEFLRDFFNITHEFTFDELGELFKNKRTSPEVKARIAKVGMMFDELSYREEKPTLKEMRDIKAMMREVMKISCPETDVEEMTPEEKEKEEALRKKEKEEEIIETVEKSKESLKKGLEEKIHKDIKAPPPDIKNDDEYQEIRKYIALSLHFNKKIPIIRKNLKNMGFNREKVNFAINDLKK
jgi:hypothetical protein